MRRLLAQRTRDGPGCPLAVAGPAGEMVQHEERSAQLQLDRDKVIRILRDQQSDVEIFELGRTVRLFRPRDAIRLLRSQPGAPCIGRGSHDCVKFITVIPDPAIRELINSALRPKLPIVQNTPQKTALGWSQQPKKAHSGHRGGRMLVWVR